LRKLGAGEGFRTLDPNLGKVLSQFTPEFLFARYITLSPYDIKPFVACGLHLRILHLTGVFPSRASPLLPRPPPGKPGKQGENNRGMIEQERTMAKITKRAIDALEPQTGRDVFAWDSELRGFGVRVKPSGVKTFLIQYRNCEGRTRRLVLGQYGALTPELARDLARKKLTAVAEGEDPSADRHAVRAGMSVSEVCDWYIEQAEVGRILGRNRRPIKASTLHMDRSRIETHIKPLLGSRLVSGLTLHDIEGMQADIAAGKSARGRKKGRGGRSTGGAGVASRTIGTLRSLLGHAARLNIIGKNPADGVRQLAGEKRQRRLSDDELRLFGQVMREAAAEGEHPTGSGAVRLMLLTGFRRMEVLGLERLWYSRKEQCIRFPDTKSSAQIRVLGEAAMACIESLPVRDGSPFVFPADW
jgi:hypothetical protein